mgnify:FL=1
MTCFRPDGHLTDEALTALVRGDALTELDRLELAEHLAYCDQCLQRYTELLSAGPLLVPEHSCRESLRRRIWRRAAQLGISRYATAAAAVALALTLLWGSAGLSGRIAQTEPTLIERAGTALTEWTDTWPQRWENALSGLSNLFDDFGVSPRNDLTQGGTHP